MYRQEAIIYRAVAMLLFSISLRVNILAEGTHFPFQISITMEDCKTLYYMAPVLFPLAEVRKTDMLKMLKKRNKEFRRWESLQQHSIRIKFLEYPSVSMYNIRPHPQNLCT